ncbi:hypothetical protein C8A00DRAFT_19289, partial [Chaetomidium leptoderma]
AASRPTGLPPVPPRQQDIPSLSRFRDSNSNSISSSHANPTARIYQNIALRRAAANNNTTPAAAGAGAVPGSSSSPSSSSSSFSSSTASLDGLMRRVLLERIEEEERNRVRPLEDPYLVGEHAAAQARAERMARENLSGLGDEVLVRENRRWDWFLAQMKDQEEREPSWKQVRRDMDRRSGSRLPFGIGMRFS